MSGSDPTAFTLSQARDALRSGSLSSVELTQAHLDALDRLGKLNAFITPTPEQALDMARASDKRLARKEAGAMEGLPIAMKDLFCTRGVLTTAGSHILDGFVPTYESTVSDNLWRSGAVMLGKANLDEFAMGSANITSHYGPVCNPWTRPEDSAHRVPGGSSGGSAAAVAGRMALAATGTDTGGSIRQPAAFCGIVGLKPTYGRCSRWGIVAFASSLDQAGPLTRTVRDAAIMLGAMAGHDPKDSTSSKEPVPDFESGLENGVQGLRVGVPAEYQVEGMAPDLSVLWERGLEWLCEAGAVRVDISLPHTRYALPTYYIVAPAEASSNLARYDGVRYGLRLEGDDLSELYANTRGEGFGPEVRRRILIGTYVLSAGYHDAYYLKAQKLRTLISRDFDAAFAQCDVILTPTTPGSAFMLGEKMDDPIAMYLNDVLTVPASLAGLPAISVPAGLDQQKLPLGLQVIGRPFDETTILQTARVLEHAAGFDSIPHMLKNRS